MKEDRLPGESRKRRDGLVELHVVGLISRVVQDLPVPDDAVLVDHEDGPLCDPLEAEQVGKIDAVQLDGFLVEVAQQRKVEWELSGPPIGSRFGGRAVPSTGDSRQRFIVAGSRRGEKVGVQADRQTCARRDGGAPRSRPLALSATVRLGSCVGSVISCLVYILQLTVQPPCRFGDDTPRSVSFFTPHDAGPGPADRAHQRSDQ